MAHLRFDPAAQPQGFRPANLSIFNNVDPDTLVREIVQNSLDAARERKRDQVDVRFQFERVPIADIPALNEYKQRFASACESQAEANSLVQAESITKTIQSQLDETEILVLWVTDNGVGLSPEHMDRLLSDGQSQKGSADSTGSYGNGHLTMFPASNLRYLLYGGLFKNNNNQIERIVAGHTILASHSHEDENCGANGYLVRDFTDDLFSRFIYFQNEQIPRLLQRKLNELQNRFDTGALVGLIGFNRFNAFETDDDAIRTIERVVASHFTPAIYCGDLIVSFETTEHHVHQIRANGLRPVLERDKNRKIRRHNSIGPPGLHAWQSLDTLGPNYREEIETSVGTIDLQFRPLRNEETTGGTNIQLFRNGMWVTNNIPHVRPRDFAKSEPFSAVILLDPVRAKRACDLVRLAEGPRHVDLDPKRLGPVHSISRIEFDTFLQELAARILELAPEQTGEDWDPNFLTLDLDGTSTGKSSSSSSDSEELTKVSPRRTGGRGKGGKGNGTNPSSEFLRYGTPLKSKATAITKEDGIHVLIVPLEDASRAELRLIKRSGADGSCDRPDPPEYLLLDPTSTLNGDSIPKSKFRFNVDGTARSIDVGRVSTDMGEMRVFAPTPNASEFSIEVDLVKRQALKLKNAVDGERIEIHE